MRLQTERTPDAAYRRRTQPTRLRHRARAPMRSTCRDRFQGLHHHPLHVTAAGSIPAPEVLQTVVDAALPIYLWPDADDEGAKHMQRIGHVLHGAGAEPLVIGDAAPAMMPADEVPKGYDAAGRPEIAAAGAAVLDDRCECFLLALVPLAAPVDELKPERRNPGSGLLT